MMERQKVIFVVGPDMCGKTQIAQELSRRIGVPYFKASSEHGDFMKNSDRFMMATRYADPRMLDFMKQTGHGAVFDRGYPCEFVYAQVFKRPADWEMLRHLDIEFAKIGATVVLCRRSSYKGILDDLDPERLNSEALETLDELYRNFIKFYTECKKIIINVDDENLDREVEEIVSQL